MNIFFYESDLQFLPGVQMPLRSTLIVLPSGGILISPIDFSLAQLADIRAKTKITEIVAPNLYHNLYVESARKSFPEADLWGAPGYAEKRPQFEWKELGRASWPHEKEIPHVLLEGASKMNEVVFFHVASSTLIVTDLCFNITEPHGFFSPLVFRMMGTYKKFGVSSLWNRFLEDAPAFSESLKKIFKWDFDRIAMAHGNLIENRAQHILRSALADKKLLIP